MGSVYQSGTSGLLFNTHSTILSARLIYREKLVEASVLLLCLLGGITSGPWLTELYNLIVYIFPSVGAGGAMPFPVMLLSFTLTILFLIVGYLKVVSISRDRSISTMISAGIFAWAATSLLVPLVVSNCQDIQEGVLVSLMLILLLGVILGLSLILAFVLLRFFPDQFVL